MAKILLSFLGLGNPNSPHTQLGYDDTAYTLPDERLCQTPLSQEAAVAFVGPERLDRVITLMTPESRARHQEELRRRLLALGLSDEQLVWDESIRDDQSSADQWVWFRSLVGHVEPGDELIFDFTHGFRSVPIIFSSAINYIQRVKGVAVKHALYGYLLNPGPLKDGDHRRGRMIDLVSFYQLNDWVEGVSALTRDANASVLADLAERARAEGEGFMGFKSLGDPELIQALRELTQCIKEINMNLVPARASRAIEVLKRQLERCEGPDHQLISLVIDTFSALGASAGSGRYDADYFAIQRALLDALVHHQLDMQAFTVMRELVGSIGVLGAPEPHRSCLMSSDKGRKARRRFGEVFVAMCGFAEEGWSFASQATPAPEDHSALLPFWERLRALGVVERLQGFMPGLVAIRNGFDHAWTASGRSALTPESSAQYRDQLFGVLDALGAAGVIPPAGEWESAPEVEPTPPKRPHYSQDPEYTSRLKAYQALILDYFSKDRAEAIYEELTQRFPEASEELKALSARVQAVTKFLNDVYGSPRRWNDQALRAEAERFGFPNTYKMACKQRENGHKREQRQQQEHLLKRQGQALTRVKQRVPPAGPHARLSEGLKLDGVTAQPLPPPPAGLHANDIRTLSPQPAWTLLLDETGKDFMTGEGSGTTAVVSLLIPEGPRARRLTPRPGFHAVDSDLDAIDEVAQELLDAEVGVMGLSLKSLKRTTQERWLDGMICLIDLNLRLMPIEGPTQVKIKIENRPPFVPSNGSSLEGQLRSHVMSRLAQAWPQRAAQINFTLQLIRKDEDPRNGYVDAVAFTWGSSAAHARARLKASGWLNTCLITDSADALTGLWDQLNAGEGLSPSAWAQLASRADADPAGRSVVASLLTLHAEMCRADAGRWRALADEVTRIEQAKTLPLPLFYQLITWLERGRPTGERLTAPLELQLLTLRLAYANHRGDAFEVDRDRRAALTAALMDEDARLVAEYTLHEAVSHTNSFDFTSARELINLWSAVHPMVPGLRLWARVRSSAGQHAAFEGRNAEAVSCFDEALGGFERLSHSRDGDLTQTSVYRAIAFMDDPARSDEEVEEAVIKAFQCAGVVGLKKALARCEQGAGAQYLHHLLTRWLVCRPNARRAQEYLSAPARAVSLNEHPWQLIEAHRALLLARAAGGVTPEAREVLGRACEISFSSDLGPAMRLIGATLRLGLVGWGEPWQGGEGVIDALAGELPMAARQLARLREGLALGAGLLGEDPVEGLWGWVGSVLAFNFR
jgi:CRISPR-associated Csx2 family protein